VSAPSIPSAPADLELIAQRKSKLQYAELRIRVLEERLRLTRIEKYGAGGEKLSQAQMQLFEVGSAAVFDQLAMLVGRPSYSRGALYSYVQFTHLGQERRSLKA